MIGKKQMKKTLTLVLFFLIMVTSINTPILAEESRIRLDMDSLSLELGSSTTMTLTLENINGGELKGFKGIENFEVLNSSTSSNTSIINGKTTRVIQARYVLMPKNTGDFQIIGYVEYEGKTYETNELDVSVKEQSTDLEGETQEIFMKTILSKDEAYFGEKLLLSYELYSRYRVDDSGFPDGIQLDGFIAEDIGDEQLSDNIVTINGNQYIKSEVKKMILDPTTTGVMKIPSLRFQMIIGSDGFFNKGKSLFLETDAAEITVKPLPTNQPSNFSGLVGTLDIEGTYSGDEVDYGQSISLQVTLSGNSNLELIEQVCPKNMKNFSVYETEKDLRVDIRDNQYIAKKEYEIILVPKTTGNVDIEPITINYFDTVTGTYKDAVIPGKTITVKGDMPSQQEGSNNSGIIGTVEREQIVINQINPTSGEDGYFMVKKSYVYIGSGCIFLLILLLAILFYLQSSKREQDLALKEIYNRCKKAKDDRAYYDILNDMVKYRYQVSIKALSRQDIMRRIPNKMVVEHILDIMDYMENHHRQGKQMLSMKELMKKIYNEMK